MVEIPCPHCAGVVKDYAVVVSDYHPLTREDIVALLSRVRQDKGRSFCAVFVRLRQGIVGMVCPPPTHGPLAERGDHLLELFVRDFQHGPVPDAVERCFQIMNG